MANAAVADPHTTMGLPLPNGKLALWLFLVTEIMFFTGLIGTYLILRNGTPTVAHPWPAPHEVHLDERIGAGNTFVLICSSLTMVLAHYALSKGDVRKTLIYVGVTLTLGTLFLVVKFFEYKSKCEHGILPGYVFDNLDGYRTATRPNKLTEKVMPDYHFDQAIGGKIEDEDSQAPRARDGQAGAVYIMKVRWQANRLLMHGSPSEETRKGLESLLHDTREPLQGSEIRKRMEEINKKYSSVPKPAFKDTDDDLTKEDRIAGVLKDVKKNEGKKHSDAAVEDSAKLLDEVDYRPLGPVAVARRVHNPKFKHGHHEASGSDKEEPGLLDEEENHELHLSPVIPNGNLWASCYFVMTGFHALHVLGGLVIFVILLLMGAVGKLGKQHESMVELTGLYWHFVDIVWIFLFPLLYLV